MHSTIIATFGHQEIISFIFNALTLHYINHKVHDEKLQQITSMIPKIIDLREKEEEKKNEIVPIKFDSMPFELIGECSSYLKVEEYMRLSTSNRTIYCATNSPIILKGLDIANYDESKLLQSV